MIPKARSYVGLLASAALLIVCGVEESANADDDPTHLGIRAGWCMNHIIRLPVDVEGNRLDSKIRGVTVEEEAAQAFARGPFANEAPGREGRGCLEEVAADAVGPAVYHSHQSGDHAICIKKLRSLANLSDSYFAFKAMNDAARLWRVQEIRANKNDLKKQYGSFRKWCWPSPLRQASNEQS